MIPVVINWTVTSVSGWGVYGLNLALQWADDPVLQAMSAHPVLSDLVTLDPLRMRALDAFFGWSIAVREKVAATGLPTVGLNTVVLAALGGDCHELPAPGGETLRGQPTVGVIFFETGRLSPEAVERAAAYDVIVTGSTWNEQVLRAHGVEHVRTVLQGVDPAMFHPAPRGGLFRDRFLVFSGGKLELRKGQDLVLAAFRRFAERHPDALLVTAWHSPWPEIARQVERSGLTAPVPMTADGRIDVVGWAADSGIAPSQVVDLGTVPNPLLPPLLRDMDVAVFPNRCEGGTNLVAMECMACGVPVILSANTGHLDLIGPGNCYPLTRQPPFRAADAAESAATDGWGDSDPDEIVDALERAYTDRGDALRRGALGAATLAPLTWHRTAAAMKDLILTLRPDA